VIIQGVKIYKKLFEDHVDYRGLEGELSKAYKKKPRLPKNAEQSVQADSSNKESNFKSVEGIFKPQNKHNSTRQ
jgi:hypothetical protein